MKKYYQANEAFAGLSAPVWRASTVVFDDVESFIHRKSRQPDGFSYGITGTPTARLLEQEIARLEGGRHCAVTPSGQAALCLAVMAFVQGGDHLLISAASYGALKTYAEKWLARLGVEVEYYPPAIAHEISRFIRPNTKMICVEAPGTVTMEMPDIPAIVTEAKKQGVMTMMDNTWASPLGFRPLEHGVDLCVEAATKFFGGHSDLLLGAVITNDAQQFAQLRETQSIMGLQTSPDDCFLVLRGLETFEIRYRRQSENAMTIATWLQQQPEVRDMLFPCLPGDQGHEVWKRDFGPGGCLFSFTLKQDNEHAYRAFFAALEHLVLGASWGGVHSLIAFYPAHMQRDRMFSRTDQAIIRLSAGLEDPELIIQDLKNALHAYVQACK
ncbi:cystathionine beta-lyase [Advenella sp. S44]|uniref:trans-sulfuration enzyme family protein n=1 Tax=Advenella sp. S44 TaxID=1982755 RepID=UPI000C2AFBB9|nr:PLP-dependent aspartate aminotransferase family protein [Advenella sp. S44]PJX27665.1 cystathionine beta-lyase [Advenella sp. S44]